MPAAPSACPSRHFILKGRHEAYDDFYRLKATNVAIELLERRFNHSWRATAFIFDDAMAAFGRRREIKRRDRLDDARRSPAIIYHIELPAAGRPRGEIEGAAGLPAAPRLRGCH